MRSTLARLSYRSHLDFRIQFRTTENVCTWPFKGMPPKLYSHLFGGRCHGGHFHADLWISEVSKPTAGCNNRRWPLDRNEQSSFCGFLCCLESCKHRRRRSHRLVLLDHVYWERATELQHKAEHFQELVQDQICFGTKSINRTHRGS